ncbi:MAG: hypothetical protein J6Y71_11970 [Ruminococcus sp.]|nr:hypothetical protein [Ruminococcus sp.]
MREFINAALPWVILSTAIAVFFTYCNPDSELKYENATEKHGQEDNSEK